MRHIEKKGRTQGEEEDGNITKTLFDSKRSLRLTGELFYYKANTFVVKWNDRSMDADVFFNFSLNEERKAAGIKMRAISPLTDFSYDFHDLDLIRVK